MHVQYMCVHACTVYVCTCMYSICAHMHVQYMYVHACTVKNKAETIYCDHAPMPKYGRLATELGKWLAFWSHGTHYQPCFFVFFSRETQIRNRGKAFHIMLTFDLPTNQAQ